MDISIGTLKSQNLATLIGGVLIK